jgi:sulfur carrier protein
MIEIVLNGEPASMPSGITVTGLLEQMQLTGKRVAVEVNREIVPRSLHPGHALNAGDRVEIVQAIGGG